MDIEVLSYTGCILLLLCLCRHAFISKSIVEIKKDDKVYDLSIGDVRSIYNSPFSTSRGPVSKVIDIKEGWVEYSFVVNGATLSPRHSYKIDEYLDLYEFKVEA